MKTVIISGAFDCLNLKHVNLIKEGLKQAVGNGRLIVLLYNGFDHFEDYGYFPTQSYLDRVDNLTNFIPEENIYKKAKTFISQELLTKIDKDKLLFVHYADDKDFPGRALLKEHNIPIKFIKPYAKKT